MVYAIYLMTCLVTCDITHGRSSKVDDYERIRTDLMMRSVAIQKYPPELDSTKDEPFMLSYKLFLINVMDVDQINQLMTILAYVQIEWNQTDLSWNKTDYNNMDEVLLDASSVWTPTMHILVGGKDSYIFHLNDNLVVHSNGNVVAHMHSYITFRCNINFLKYPFDTQTCSFGFFKEKLVTSEVATPSCELLPANNNNFVVPGEWEMLNYYCEAIEDSNQENYPRFSIVVRRRRVYYVITIVFPMVLTSVMIPLVFLIPTRTGEKISYLVTIFTSTAIFLSYASTVMPRSLTNLPYLSMLLVEVLTEGFFAVLITLWVVNKFDGIHYKDIKETEKKNQTKLADKNDKETCLDKKLDTERSAECKSFDQQMAQLKRLDRILFLLFANGQIMFLIFLFLATEWIQ